MDNPDGRYATKPWSAISDQLAMRRTLAQDSGPSWQAPVLPVPDPYEMVPPMYGYRTTELGIQDILNGVYSRVNDRHVEDSQMTDWSGQVGGYEATLRETNLGSAL